MEYWEECISEAMDDVGLSATEEQIKGVAEWVEGAHDNYGLATGRDVADTNYHASYESKIREANDRTEKELSAASESFDKRISDLHRHYELRISNLVSQIEKLQREVA